MKDYYKILGVNEKATSEEISKAYRDLARKYHPDMADNKTSKKMQEVNEAFEVLNKPEKRSQYDMSKSGMPFGGFPDFFSNIFGHRGPMGRDRTKVIKTNVNLTFSESILGCTKEVTFLRNKICSECENGVSSWETCSTCNGTGQMQLSQPPFCITTTCNSCGGNGKIPKDKCQVCNGVGYLGDETEMVVVSIPIGVEDGSILQVSGKGEIGKDGRRGNLHVHISVASHPFYFRKGEHLFCKVPVTYSQLILGAEISVPTLIGNVSLIIPPGTPPDKRLRLKGMGVGKRGDMFAVLDLEIPEINEEYKETLGKLVELESKYVSLKRKDFGK